MTVACATLLTRGVDTVAGITYIGCVPGTKAHKRTKAMGKDTKGKIEKVKEDAESNVTVSQEELNQVKAESASGNSQHGGSR